MINTISFVPTEIGKRALDSRLFFAALTRAQAGFAELRPSLSPPYTFRKNHPRHPRGTTALRRRRRCAAPALPNETAELPWGAASIIEHELS
jgi:hypothetical protein